MHQNVELKKKLKKKTQHHKEEKRKVFCNVTFRINETGVEKALLELLADALKKNDPEKIAH